MKRVIGILMCLVLLIPCFVFDVPEVKATTLGDLEKALEKTKQEKNEQKQQEKLTNAQMAAITSKVSKLQDDIALIEQDMIVLEEEIKTLNLDILAKDKEIKKIINFMQLSEGNSAYLEYAFGAQDFTDFIFRVSVTEQLVDYNDSLITDFNQMIEDNHTKQKNLTELEVSKEKEQDSLEQEYASLGDKIEEIYDIYNDLDESIKIQEETIAMYKNKGCKSNEDIKVCGRAVIPADSAFWRPLVKAWITSNFGYRTYTLNGKKKTDYHSGLDMSANGGTKIYSVAKGVVSSITRKSSCGGNYIFIHHYVNGKYYTTMYMHMRAVNVEKGDIVTKDTVIGTTGGTKSEYWDKCSTGGHLHFSILNGRVGIDYSAWSSTFYAKLVNPRNLINFPKGYGYFSNRTTAY